MKREADNKFAAITKGRLDMPVESDFRGSAARHHGRHHRNTRRDVNSGGVNSPAAQPTRTDDEHNQHKGEKSHEERKTKMTKRTARIVSSFAVLFILIFGVADGTFASERRGFRTEDARADVRSRDLKVDGVRFSRVEVRLDGFGLRDGDWRGFRYTRGRENATDYRGLGWDTGRIYDGFGLRAREIRLGKDLRQRTGFYFGRVGYDIRNIGWTGWDIRGKGDFKTRFGAGFSKELKGGFEVRPVDGFGFGRDSGYGLGSFID